MSNRYFEISDVVSFQPVAIDSNVKRLFEAKDSASESGYSLLVRVNATHAGLITGNYGIYFPNHMKDGLKSFTKPYQKPWLLNHDDSGSTVGRVISADYVSLADNYPRLKDKILQLEAGTLDRDEEVKLMKSMLKSMESPKHQGFGFASLMVKLHDKDTIEKVLDGSYLTVSTRQRSERATCSICEADWLYGDYCNHFPGEYDKESKQRCYILTGKLSYKEGSFVPVPADEYAQVVEIYEDDVLKDSLTIQPDRKLIVPADIFLQGADNFTNVKNNFDLFSHTEILDQLVSLVKEQKNATVEIQDANVQKAKDNQGGNPVMTLKELMGDHDLLVGEVEKVLPGSTDALSYKSIAKLADSEFYGPQRTFPKVSKQITDAYVQILTACEDEEAKGFVATMKAESSVDEVATAIDTFKPDELMSMFNKLVHKMQDNQQLFNDSIMKIPAIRKLHTENDNLKKQVSTLETDLQNSVDNVASLATELKDAFIELNYVHSSIAEDVLPRKEYEDSVKELSVSELKEKVKGMAEGFDAQKLRDVLNSQTIDDPNLKADQEKERVQQEINKQVSATYFALVSKDANQAQLYLMTQIRLGKVPKNFKPSRTN